MADARMPASRREQLVFAVASAVVVVHVLVDAFVVLEPGVRRSDHLLSGLVPTAVLVAAAVLYPRLRPGLRASMALVLGVLCFFGAELAMNHAMGPGPAGDDFTGLLLLPAGMVLCGLGVWLLWRSRKREGHVWLRRGLIALGILVVAYELVLPIGVAVVATHRPREEARTADLGRASQRVSLTTSDGLRLSGQYVPSQNGAAVITFPREWTARQARLLADHGYGVLLLDMRGYGSSEGDPNAFGWRSTRDIDAAVAWLKGRPDVVDGRIGGLGLSVGGEQMIEAAAGNGDLRAVVSEGAGERSLRETLLYSARGLPSLPAAAVETAAVTVLSGDTPPPALDDLVARIAPRPVMLIYAGRGGGGEELQPEYYAAAGQPKTLWKIEQAGHTGGLSAAPQQYERRVIGFFDAALLGEGPGAAAPSQ